MDPDPGKATAQMYSGPTDTREPGHPKVDPGPPQSVENLKTSISRRPTNICLATAATVVATCAGQNQVTIMGAASP